MPTRFEIQSGEGSISSLALASESHYMYLDLVMDLPTNTEPSVCVINPWSYSNDDVTITLINSTISKPNCFTDNGGHCHAQCFTLQ